MSLVSILPSESLVSFLVSILHETTPIDISRHSQVNLLNIYFLIDLNQPIGWGWSFSSLSTYVGPLVENNYLLPCQPSSAHWLKLVISFSCWPKSTHWLRTIILFLVDLRQPIGLSWLFHFSVKINQPIGWGRSFAFSLTIVIPLMEVSYFLFSSTWINPLFEDGHLLSCGPPSIHWLKLVISFLCRDELTHWLRMIICFLQPVSWSILFHFFVGLN